MILIAQVVALMCTGLAAGIFLGHRAGVSCRAGTQSFKLRPATAGHSQNIRAHDASTDRWLCAGSALWAVLLRSRWRTAEFWLVSGAALAMVCILGMTRAVNLPINKRLMTWNAAAPPSSLSTEKAPWERVHSIRPVLAIIAFAGELIALSIFRTS